VLLHYALGRQQSGRPIFNEPQFPSGRDIRDSIPHHPTEHALLEDALRRHTMRLCDMEGLDLADPEVMAGAWRQEDD